MRTNGFIFIAMGLTAVTLAGTPDYLPNVGPVGLHFAPATKPSAAVTLPPLPTSQTTAESPATHPELAEIPTVEPKPEPPTNALTQNPPVIVLQTQTGSPTNALGPLIGPQMETNNAVTPQMFLRFFTPNQNGQSREAIIVTPPGFSPAPPPTPSSTATYTQPKS